MTPLERPGRFKLRPYAAKPVEGKPFQGQAGAPPTNSFNVLISFLVVAEFLPDGTWADWTPYERTVDGFFNLVGKDGRIGPSQERNVADLIRYAGWSGEIEDLLDGERFLNNATDCCAMVDWNEFENKRTLRVAYLSDERFSGPGIADDRKRAIGSAYGANFRAIAGNVRRNIPPAPPPLPQRVPAPPPPGITPPTGVSANAQPVPF